jgi:glycosyltransferase involved in cell wall biosynthesis
VGYRLSQARAGASETVRDGENSFVLRHPEDYQELAVLLRRLCTNPNLCIRLGEEAARTAKGQTWDHNALDTWESLNAVLAKKSKI